MIKIFLEKDSTIVPAQLVLKRLVRECKFEQ